MFVSPNDRSFARGTQDALSASRRLFVAAQNACAIAGRTAHFGDVAVDVGVTNLFGADGFTETGMLKTSGAFLARDADGADDGFSRNETTRLTRSAVFGPVALVDHSIAFGRAGAFARIGRARRRVERGATRDIAGERATANLFFAWGSRDDGCRGDDRRWSCADARQITRTIDIAGLHALGASGASAGDLLAGNAFLSTAADDRRREGENEGDPRRGTRFSAMHDEGEIT